MYEIGQAEIDAVARVINSGQLFRYRGGEGGEVDTFERSLCAMLDQPYFVTVTSGTAALICGLVGLEIGPGDEVIVPGYTFMATASAVVAVGAIPVVVDIDESCCLDPVALERAIGPRTKAVIPVHMRGLPCDLDGIQAVCRRHGLKLLEDACQGFGGQYHGRWLGAIGDAGAYSFNHFKTISCGEGGGVTTASREVFERALTHHDSGTAFRGHAGEMTIPLFCGTNFRCNELLGAVLNVQLSRLAGIRTRLRERRDLLRERLDGSSAFELSPVNDVEGDLGAVVGLLFETAAQRQAAERHLASAGQGFAAGSPIDSGIHVYSRWQPIIEQRGSYHPAHDAYRRPENEGCRKTVTPDMLPRTLDILDRTLHLVLDTKTPLEHYAALAAKLRELG